MFKPGPDEAELAMFGMSIDDFPDEIIEIWPDTMQAVALFRLVCDQWIMGPGGPVALNMQVPIALMERMKLEESEYFELLEDLKVMAAVGLRLIAESRPKKD